MKRTRDTAVFQKRILPPSAITLRIYSISEGDYVLIETKEGKPIGDSFYGKYDNYSVYFFDTDSCVLYYLHSNI